ncbi:MAG: hypothetical protein KZQ70_11320 [gamma proteobacterium symbiont of Lucinoma myriamae]|nr:hypothetical protein [gamma proteobacterium symbiont of Lucinoma myriamae]
MKFIKTILLLFILVVPQISLADLSHIEDLSCKAILCLTSGSPPNECDPALNYFKSLKAKKWKDTFKKRRKFLDICPDNNDSGLKDVLASGAFRCDKPDLLDMLNPKFDWDGNVTQTSTLPSYCVSYYGHSFTRLGSLPVKINPSGYCYDEVQCNANNFPWQKKPIEKVGGRCYEQIKKPQWNQDLGRGVECLNLWK